MRILHVVTNADLGGAPRVVVELANRAVRDGHACAVASVPEGPMWDALDPGVERRPLTRLRREISPLDDFLAVLELAALYRAWKPEVIHLHSSKAGVLGRVAAGRLAKRVVYTIHGFDTILKSHRVFLPLERLLARRCGAIVPVSGYDARNLVAAGVPGAHVPIPNGATDRLARRAGGAAADRMLAARSEGRFVVLSIARLAPPKRFDLFLETASAFDPDATAFFWIGDPPSAVPRALPPNVVLLGELPEAGDYANLCDAFVLFSDYEGLPMSILEALSCGKPVVASAVGGIPEAVDGEVGAVVANSVKDAARALRSWFDDPAGRLRAGAAARARFEARFSAERMWAAYRDLYASLAGTGLLAGAFGARIGNQR